MRHLMVLLFVGMSLWCSGQGKTFTEEDLVNVIRQYHPVAKQARLSVQMAAADVTSARGAFDPLLTTEQQRKETQGINYYNQRLTEVRIPAWYGIDVVAGQETISGSRLNPEKTKGTLSYVGISVPLLQNILIDKRRAVIRQAKIYQELSEVQQRAAINDVLMEGLKSYWEWWEHHQQLDLIRESMQNATRRFGMVKTAQQLGDRPAIDTLEALTQVQYLEQKQNEVLTNLMKSRLQLSMFLWLENSTQYDLPEDVIPQAPAEKEPELGDRLISQAGNHPELIQYQFKLKALELEKLLKLQALVPAVYLKYQQTGYNFSKTFQDTWFDQNYRFGVTASIPLRLSESRGAYRKAKLKLESARLEQANKRVQVYNKVRQYQAEWEQTNRQLMIQNLLVTNIANLQKGEEIKFMNGESSLFLVNAREAKTIEARQKLIELQAKNQKSRVSMQWAAGALNQ